MYGDFFYDGTHDITYEIASRTPTQHHDIISVKDIFYKDKSILFN